MNAKKPASRRSLKSDLARVDAHVVKKGEYEELPELNEEMLARAEVKRGWKDAQEQHGAFGAAAVKQVQRRAVQDQQCQQETRLTDEQCRQKWVGTRKSS